MLLNSGKLLVDTVDTWMYALTRTCLLRTISQTTNRYHNSTVSFTDFSKCLTASFCAMLFRAKFELGFANAVIVFVAHTNQSFMIASIYFQKNNHKTIRYICCRAAILCHKLLHINLTRKDFPT